MAIITGTKKGDNLTGTLFDDSISSGDGNDIVNGLDGNDYIDGGKGNDTLIGGSGNDTLVGGAGKDSVSGGAGDDFITMLLSARDVDAIDAGADTDTLLLSGAVPRSGVVVVDLSAGDQVVSIGGMADTSVQQNFENLDASGLGLGARVMVTGSAGANAITGSGGADTIDGAGGDDTIAGGGGNDLIFGGDGNNTLAGGAGVDTVFGGDGNDAITMLVTAGDVDSINAGNGTDTLLLSGAVPRSGVVVVDLSAGDQVVSIGGMADTSVQQNFENLDASGLGLGARVMVTGSAGANAITGSGGADTIDGAGGDDTISGYGGNDILVGGAGNDVLFGGAGNDTIDADGTGDQDVIVFDAVLSTTDVLSNGTDTINNFDADPTGGQDMISLDALFDSLGVETAARAARYQVSGTQLQIDLDNNGSFEYTIATVTASGVFDILDVNHGTSS